MLGGMQAAEYYFENPDACAPVRVAEGVPEEGMSVGDSAKRAVALILPQRFGRRETGAEETEGDAYAHLSVRPVGDGITNLLFLVSTAPPAAAAEEGGEAKEEGDKTGDAVLVRVYGAGTEAFIDRARENALYAQLSKSGLSPRYIAQFENGRLEEFLHGAVPVEPSQMAEGFFARETARRVAGIHAMSIDDALGAEVAVNAQMGEWSAWKDIARFVELVDQITFETEEDRALLRQLNMPWVKTQLARAKEVLADERLLEEARQPEGVVQSLLEDIATTATAGADSEPVSPEDLRASFVEGVQLAQEIVVTHNDLLAGNVLTNPEWDHVVLIDYEYASPNPRAYDYANHFCEIPGFEADFSLYPSIDAQLRCLVHYLQFAAPDAWRRLAPNQEEQPGHVEGVEACSARQLALTHGFLWVANKMTLTSHFYWGIWSVIQARYSPIDFDFLAYANRRMRGLRQHKALFWGVDEPEPDAAP